MTTHRLYEVHCDFPDGSRSTYDGLTLGDVLAIVGSFDNLEIVDCSISPVEVAAPVLETMWAVVPDRNTPGDWRVEGFDADGRCYVSIFAGPEAERRATEYHAWLAA